MKKMLLVGIAVMSLFTTQALADSSDIAAVYATGSYSSATGLNLGFGKTINDNLEARADFSYLPFEKGGLKYTRMPIAVSGKYYHPLSESVKAYAQLGAEVSIDSVEVIITVPGFGSSKTSEQKARLGITPAVGCESEISPGISLFLDARNHFVTDSYATVALGLKYSY